MLSCPCPPAPRTADEEKATLARKRAVLRLLVELLLAGVYSAHSVVLQIVKHLAAAADFQRDGEAAQAALSLLTTLAKVGREELLGLPPGLPVSLAPDSLEQGDESAGGGLAAAAAAYTAAVQRYEAALAGRYTLPAEAQAQLRGAMERVFEGACTALQGAHAALQATEAENARVLNSRGDLPEDMAGAYEAQRQGFEGLQRTAAALAEVLDRRLPELKQEVTRIVAAPDDGAAGGAADQQAQQVGAGVVGVVGRGCSPSAVLSHPASAPPAVACWPHMHPPCCLPHLPLPCPALPVPRCLKMRSRAPFTSRS